MLASHRPSLEVGVAGVPDATKGEVVKAWVVVARGPDRRRGELRAGASERLAPYKVPSAIESARSCRRAMVGKVLRRALAGTQPA